MSDEVITSLHVRREKTSDLPEMHCFIDDMDRFFKVARVSLFYRAFKISIHRILFCVKQTFPLPLNIFIIIITFICFVIIINTIIIYIVERFYTTALVYYY